MTELKAEPEPELWDRTRTFGFVARLHWKKSCSAKPKKGFVHATKPLKGLLVCNEIEILTNTYQAPNKLFEGFVVLYETKKRFRFRCILIDLLMVS
jgi:hypothetical protein